MIILNNEEVGALLSMENCLRLLERDYQEQSQGTAVNRPRSDLYLPATTSDGVYCFKTMEGALTHEKVVALRLNSDVIKWEEKGGRIIKDKVPAAPGNKWVGLILLFSAESGEPLDRKSTRLNSSHLGISYAVFCLKKKIKRNKMYNS